MDILYRSCEDRQAGRQDSYCTVHTSNPHGILAKCAFGRVMIAGRLGWMMYACAVLYCMYVCTYIQMTGIPGARSPPRLETTGVDIIVDRHLVCLLWLSISLAGGLRKIDLGSHETC